MIIHSTYTVYVRVPTRLANRRTFLRQKAPAERPEKARGIFLTREVAKSITGPVIFSTNIIINFHYGWSKNRHNFRNFLSFFAYMPYC